MSHYLWWPVVAFLYYTGYGYISQINNQQGGKYTMWMWAYGAACPLWAIVSKITKNITFDAALYDALIVICGFFGLWLAGAMKDFSAINYFGLTIMVVGIIILKV
jgi:hypothetical protein